jgi:anti-anti-sigma factor
MSQRKINLAVSVSFEGDIATLALLGDVASSPEMIEQQLEELVARKPPQVMLDLSKLEYMSSLGLGLILSLRRAVVGYGGSVRIAAANTNVMDVLRRTSVDVLFDPNRASGKSTSSENAGK